MTAAEAERLSEMLAQSMIDRPPDAIVARHMIGLLKALDRWLLSQPQARESASLVSSHRSRQ
jgi:hypothetical protein